MIKVERSGFARKNALRAEAHGMSSTSFVKLRLRSRSRPSAVCDRFQNTLVQNLVILHRWGLDRRAENSVAMRLGELMHVTGHHVFIARAGILVTG